MLIVQTLFIGALAIYLWSLIQPSIVPAVVEAAAARVTNSLQAGAPAATLTAELLDIVNASANLLQPESPHYALHIYQAESNALLGAVGNLALNSATVQPYLQAALTDTPALTAHDGLFWGVRPIIGTDNTLLGVAVFAAQSQLFWRYLLNTLVFLLGTGLTLFTVFAVLVGTIFGYFTARRLTRRLEQIQQISAAWGHGDLSAKITDATPDEIGELSAHLNEIAAQLNAQMHLREQISTLEERNRIARDLHDSVKQQIFAAIMQIASIQSLIPPDNTRAQTHLQTALNLTQHAQTELTTLIHELRPVTDIPERFAQRIYQYVNDWSQRTHIRASIALDAQVPHDATRQQALFRILQEALANIERHSHASDISVTLSVDERMLTLQIEDNGRGFDPTQTARGIGTQSMQERALALGGTFVLESVVNKGTRITVQLRDPNGTN